MFIYLTKKCFDIGISMNLCIDKYWFNAHFALDEKIDAVIVAG